MIVVVGPRRTGTTTLFNLAKSKPARKALCPPKSLFDIFIMRLHLRRYGHYICPDIVHDDDSVKCLVQWKGLLSTVNFVVLERDDQELFLSQKQLAERFALDVDEIDLRTQRDCVHKNVTLLEGSDLNVRKLNVIELMRQSNISGLVSELPFIDEYARIVVTNAGVDLPRRRAWQKAFVPLYQRLFTFVGVFWSAKS